MKAAVIDYGAGNLRSVVKALERVAAPEMQVVLARSPADIASADRLVLPGVGAFRDCMANLAAIDGMVAAINDFAMVRQRPFLGICVGMQLMASRGLEHGVTAGLGWFDGDVLKIEAGDSLKVPHMGWNNLRILSEHTLMAGITNGDHAYFVHSYWLQPPEKSNGWVVADTEYGQPLTAAIARDNIFGTQFHPEKSQATGLRLLDNFLRWQP